MDETENSIKDAYGVNAMPDSFLVSQSRYKVGSIDVGGAKLEAPKILIESALTDEECVINNYSEMLDTLTALDYAEACGTEIKHRSHDSISVFNRNRSIIEDDDEYIEYTMHDRSTGTRSAAVDLVRFGQARLFNTLGGCDIGDRNPSGIVGILEQLGAKVDYVEHGARLYADKLYGATVNPNRRVAETETALTAATLAVGKTTIIDAAKTPEIDGQIKFLIKMGAKIKSSKNPNNRMIIVDGTDELHGCEHTIGPCRLEAASFAILAAMSDGTIRVNGADSQHMKAFHKKFKEMGGEWKRKEDGIVYGRRGLKLSPANIETTDYPGLDTDPAALLAAMSAYAVYENSIMPDYTVRKFDEPYVIHDRRYENRPAFLKTFGLKGVGIEFGSDCEDDTCNFKDGENQHVARIKEQNPYKTFIMDGREKLEFYHHTKFYENYFAYNPDYEAGIGHFNKFRSALTMNGIALRDLRGAFGILAMALSDPRQFNIILTGGNYLDRGYSGLFNKLRENLQMEFDPLYSSKEFFQ